MRYLSEVLHDNTQQHKVSRGGRRNSEKTLYKLEAINPMTICKATRVTQLEIHQGIIDTQNHYNFYFFSSLNKRYFTQSLLQQNGFSLLKRGVTICKMTLQNTLQSLGKTKQLNSAQVRLWERESLCSVWELCKHLNLRTLFYKISWESSFPLWS